MRRTVIMILLFWASAALSSADTLKLTLDKQFTLGKKDFLFESISSVCEDKAENFYVLDRKAFKVYKFSKDGKLLFSFGNRGQGPADYIAPHSIYLTNDGHLVVNEERHFVSIFNEMGKFIKRIKVPKGLGLFYLNENLYHCWLWTPEGKQQVLIDRKGQIKKKFYSIKRDTFSINFPDETGRMVMFNHFVEEYVPDFFFSRFGNQAVIGVNNKYEIILIDMNGAVKNKISRDLKPDIITPDEKDYFKNLIDEDTDLPDFTKKKFIKKIPGNKNFFQKVLISKKDIWVFGVKENLIDEDSLVPAELYDLDTSLKGTLKIKDVPEFISEENLYVIDSNEDDELLLTKFRFSIEKE
jgi:hypothetical protein